MFADCNCTPAVFNDIPAIQWRFYKPHLFKGWIFCCGLIIRCLRDRVNSIYEWTWWDELKLVNRSQLLFERDEFRLSVKHLHKQNIKIGKGEAWNLISDLWLSKLCKNDTLKKFVFLMWKYLTTISIYLLISVDKVYLCSCFGLNCVIFQCSYRSWDCRDKDFTSPKSSLNIAIQQILEALMIYTLESQEWMMVLANPFLSHSLCVFLNFLLWKFLGFNFFLVEKTWIRWRKPSENSCLL